MHLQMPPDMDKNSVYSKQTQSLQMCHSASEILDSLTWWKDPRRVCVGTPTLNQTSLNALTTDVSLLGWGVEHRETAQDKWLAQESAFQINILELRVVHYAFQHFLHAIRGHSVRVMLDNRTAIYYIYVQDRARSQSWCAVFKARQLMHLPADRDISSLSTRLHNTITDKQDQEWELKDFSIPSATQNVVSSTPREVAATTLLGMYWQHHDPIPFFIITHLYS